MPNRWVVKMHWDAESQTELVYEELFKLGQDMGKAHKKEREKTIQTWAGDRPSWKTVTRRAGRAVKIIVMRVGDPFGMKKWGWLEKGTKVRYMGVNYPNWQSKTKENWVGSTAGAGHTTGLGYPWPGIKARNWNKIINAKLNKRWIKRIPTSIRSALRRRRPGAFSGKRFLYG